MEVYGVHIAMGVSEALMQRSRNYCDQLQRTTAASGTENFFLIRCAAQSLTSVGEAHDLAHDLYIPRLIRWQITIKFKLSSFLNCDIPLFIDAIILQLFSLSTSAIEYFCAVN